MTPSPNLSCTDQLWTDVVRSGQESGTHTQQQRRPPWRSQKGTAIARAGAGGGLDKTGPADSVSFLLARLQRRHEPAEVPAHQRVGVDGAVAGHGVRQLPRHQAGRHLPSAASRSCTLPHTSSACICSCAMDGTFSFCFCTQQGCARTGIVSW